MTSIGATALIADDEPLLRKALVRALGDAWPELKVVAQARNGREAVEQFEELHPDICFLDVHMPGLSGIEAAQFIGSRALLVFVTAHDTYAVQAFERGVLDYLVKPVEAPRLLDTVSRLKRRMQAALQPTGSSVLLEELVAHLRKDNAEPALRWLRVSVGQSVRMVAVDEVDYLRSDGKYTVVAWHAEDAKQSEGLIRMPIKDLVARLDAAHFAQVHRSVVVNLRAIRQVTRDANETAAIYLKGRAEVLPVSRSYLHLFKQM